MQKTRITTLLLTAAFALSLMGCATVPTQFPGVGPNPYLTPTADSNGYLEVFTAVEQQVDGLYGDGGLAWSQHTGYIVSDVNGKVLKRVSNMTGHYSEEPRIIALPPGNYLVKAQAKDYFHVQLAVLIKAGIKTTVYLDNSWKPAEYAPKAKLAYSPAGFPIGWLVEKDSEVKK